MIWKVLVYSDWDLMIWEVLVYPDYKWHENSLSGKCILEARGIYLDSPLLVPKKEQKVTIFCHVEGSLKRLVMCLMVMCLMDPFCHLSRNQKCDRIILEVTVEENLIYWGKFHNIHKTTRFLRVLVETWLA